MLMAEFYVESNGSSTRTRIANCTNLCPPVFGEWVPWTSCETCDKDRSRQR